MKLKLFVFNLLVIVVVLLSTRVSAQVVINEVQYDPTGPDTGLEYIELLNVSMSTFDLSGFELKLADSNYYVFTSFQLLAGGRVLIHNNASGEDTLTDLFTGSLTNMGNTSGSVALFSGPHATDNIVDYLQYGALGQQWQSAAVGAGIWTDSDFIPDADEGFSINLFPDGDDNDHSSDWTACDPSPLESNCAPPEPTATFTPSPPPTNTPSLTPTQATQPPTSTPTSALPTSTPVPTITPTSSPQPTSTLIPTETQLPTSTPTSSPIVSDVIINEVFYDPMGTDTGLEWIEIVNTGLSPITLTSWVLRPDSAGYFTFPEFDLDPMARVAVHINTEGIDTDTQLFAGLSSNMGNSSGSIVLFNGTPYSTDTIVDFVEYGSADQTWESLAVDAGIWTAGDFTLDVAEGFSLNRYPDSLDTNSSDDWSQCEPSFLSENCVSPTATPTSAATDTPSPGTPTPTSGPDTPTQTPVVTPTPYPTVSQVIINEVLYNPSGNDSGYEFIELLNNSAYSVDLTGFDLKPDTSSYYTFPDFVLGAGERVVVRVNTSGDDTLHELFTGSTSNMGNTAGAIALFSSTTHSASTIVDYVLYGAGGQTWESAAVTAGIWNAGDYVPTCDEAFSMNLDPDGVDTNNSNDWSQCEPSMHFVNCQTVPTPTLTPTTPPGTPTYTPEPTSTPQPRQGVVINEVLFDPEGVDTGQEYIELYNNSSDPVSLTGYDLKPDSSAYFTFPAFILEPESFVVIHVNDEGTNTQSDLYTGPTSNMANSAGFVALFSSDTHGATTIVDYIAYGAGGQTWESTAVSAGIWTSGDFIVIESLEGFSLSLCPDGADYDSSSNWQLDAISPGTGNVCNEPTPTPTATGTPTPTFTPTSTPTPRPTVEPVVQMAGFGQTNYRFSTGGVIQILAWVTDPEDDIETVKVTLGGEVISELYDDGSHGDYGVSDGIFGVELDLPASANPESGSGLYRLQMRIVSTDSRGFDSNVWPLLTVTENSGFDTKTALNWWDDSSLSCRETQSRSSASERPVVFMAGYMDTRISHLSGGRFTLLAVTTGKFPIMQVEVYYYGLPTGVMLLDDGLNNDFGPGDGVFGLSFNIGPDIIDPGQYALQLKAKDIQGSTSDLWPYLTISE